MNPVAEEINNLLLNEMGNIYYEDIPSSHYSTDEAEFFHVGLIHYETMIVTIRVPHDAYKYDIDCKARYVFHVNYKIEEAKLSPGVRVEKDGNELLSYIFKLSNSINDLAETHDVFIRDFYAIASDCNQYTQYYRNQQHAESDNIKDVWYSFFFDLFTITKSASHGSMPNPSETNAKIIDDVVGFIYLDDKLAEYRALDENKFLYPYYPTDLNGQIKYVEGLLRAIFLFFAIAKEEGFSVCCNNITFDVMRGLGFKMEDRLRLIYDVYRQVKEEHPTLDDLDYIIELAEDGNRGIMDFENIGIISDASEYLLSADEIRNQVYVS